MGQSCPLWSRAIKTLCGVDLRRTYKVRNFWVMSEKKLQKAADDSQNEENTNDNTGFIVLHTRSAFFPVPEINKSFLILNKSEIFLLYNTSLNFKTKLV